MNKKIIGTVMEINPFHSGHEYFLKKIKEQNKDCLLIVLLSTTIVQRGEFSILSKKTKVDLLKKNGADIVIEFPAVLANQGGEFFGHATIEVLNKFGIHTFYCGSETNNIETIKKIFNNHKNNLKKTNNIFKKGYLKESLSTLKSNDILALSYYKGIQKINTTIDMKLIKREGLNYNSYSIDLKEKFISATAIREKLLKKEYKELLQYTDDLVIKNHYFVNEKNLINIFLNNLLILEDKNIFLSEEGQLINKINSIINCKSDEIKKINKISELSQMFSDKNNSKYKMQRLIINVIFNITKEEYCSVKMFENKYFLMYFSENSRSYIKKYKDIYFQNYKNRSQLYDIDNRIDSFLKVIENDENFKFNYQKINNK